MPRVTTSQLRAITEAIVRCCHPARVILFGSQVRSAAENPADIDLLIVDDQPFSPQRSHRQAIGRIRRGLPKIGIPVDILLFDQKEIAQWKDTTNHPIAGALREGMVLHERS